MKAKPLTVGPIVGHTAHNLVRIFGRAKFRKEDGKPRRAHGVIRYRQVDSASFSKPLYFKMNPNFDMTGVAVLTNLMPETDYHYQMAWFFSDVDSKQVDVSTTLDWREIETYQIRTASNDEAKTRNIVLGSCRYALRIFGGTWFDDRGDKTFKSILQKKDSDGVDQLIMCGDQIYADDLNILSADQSLDEYNRRYREVFSSEHLRSLMARVPTYMTLDDHEIENDWPKSASKKDWVTKFPAAIHAYTTYQASHSPLFQIKKGRLDGTPTHLWYNYEDGCCEVFVCDTRTERCLDEGEREIIGPRQMKALLQWLNNGNGRVKCIVSSVPFYESESDDKWHGHIRQRDQLFEFIRENALKRVVMMAGDVHACMSSQLHLGNDVKITSVVSSAFFWPYPHPRRRSFKLSGKLKTNTDQTYNVSNPSKVYPTDAFAHLKITTKSIDVTFVSRKGKKLGGKKYVY